MWRRQRHLRRLLPAGVAVRLLALAAPLLAAAAPGPIQSYDTYRAWLVACDNALACEAKGLEDGGAPADARVVLAAGPDAVPVVTLTADTSFSLRDVAIDGAPVALAVGDWRVETQGAFTAVTSLRPAAARALLARMVAGQRVTLGGEEAAVPLDGLAAALLRIDERQGRLGGVTALIHRGPLPAARVPSAPALPRMPPRPVAARLAAGEDARLIARTRADQRVLLTREECEDGHGTQAEAFALRPDLALVLLPCLHGAYQSSPRPFLVPRGQGLASPLRLAAPFLGATRDDAQLDELTEGAFDPKTGELSAFAKGRGLADCGTAAAWLWDGGRFRLRALSLQRACGGAAPGDWPTLFRARE